MAMQATVRTMVVGRHLWVGLPRAGERDLMETYRRGHHRLGEEAHQHGGEALGVAVAGLTAQELQLTALLSA